MRWGDVDRWHGARRFMRRLLWLRVIRPWHAKGPQVLIDSLFRFAAERQVFGALPSGRLQVAIVVSHELSATGAPKVLVEVIAACRESGWDVVVVAPLDGPYRAIFVEQGALVIVAPDALSKRTPVVDLATLASVAICNTIVTAKVVQALQSRLPVAWYLHEGALIATMVAQDQTIRDAIKSVRVLWATSELTATTLRSEGGSPQILTGACASLIGKDADLPAIDAGPLVNFVLLGSVEPRKGQDLMLDALELLRPATRAALRVTLYGKPLDLAFEKALLARIENLDEVSYAGAVLPDAALAAVLESDVVIVPSRDEPLSLAAAEGLSAGRVVICSTCCGISNFLVDGSSAFIASDCSPLELARTIESAMARRADWAMIGRAGRAVYDANFSTTRFKSQVMEGLNSLHNEFP